MSFRNIFTLLLLSLLGASAFSQTTSGSLIGTIADKSGAVVSGSTVVAVATATNTSHTTQSDVTGYFAFPTLQPGTYKISVNATGFAPAESVVQVQLGQASKFDFRLTPGSTSQTKKFKLVEALSSRRKSITLPMSSIHNKLKIFLPMEEISFRICSRLQTSRLFRTPPGLSQTFELQIIA